MCLNIYYLATSRGTDCSVGMMSSLLHLLGFQKGGRIFNYKRAWDAPLHGKTPREQCFLSKGSELPAAPLAVKKSEQAFDHGAGEFPEEQTAGQFWPQSSVLRIPRCLLPQSWGHQIFDLQVLRQEQNNKRNKPSLIFVVTVGTSPVTLTSFGIWKRPQLFLAPTIGSDAWQS